MGRSQVTEGAVGLAEKGMNRRKVLSVRQEPRSRMLKAKAKEETGMATEDPCTVIRSLYVVGDEVFTNALGMPCIESRMTAISKHTNSSLL